MATIKNNNFPLRFRTKAQKNNAKKIARHKNDSLNGYILSLIDLEIEHYKTMNKPEINVK
jgi:hypothetical protein